MLIDTEPIMEPYTQITKRVRPTWAVDNPEALGRPDKRVRFGVEKDLNVEPLVIDLERRYTKEESPELMPEDDDMLAAFAAAVDASCIEVNLGMAGMGHDGGEEDVVMEVEVEEDTDEILASLDDEPLPSLKIRPPDVVHPLTDSLAKEPLVLDKKSVIGYLRPFQFKIEGLEGITALEPYLVQLLGEKKNVQKKKSKKASKPDCTEQDDTGIEISSPPSAQVPSSSKRSSDVEWSRKAGDNFLRGLMTYPLPKAQLEIVRLFAAQTTIVFTDLLDLEQVLKLIALSVQVTVPYYGHCLFPNLRNVVFTSSFRLQMMQVRHADPTVFDTTTSKVRPDVLPHRTSILLYWLAESYDVCIHYPSVGEKESCIAEWATRLVRDEAWDKMEAKAAAEEDWIALDTLDCMLSPDSQKGLGRLSLHSVQVGATFNLAVNVKTTIRFAPRSKDHSYGSEETIGSMAKLISACVEAQTGWVTFFNIVHLIATRPFGPATTLPMKRQKGELRLQLFNHLLKGFGRSDTRMKSVKKRCREGDTLGISKECRTCGQWCEEYDCAEKIDDDDVASPSTRM